MTTLIVLNDPAPVLACDCVGFPHHSYYEVTDEVAYQLLTHEAVFLGTVTSVEPGGRGLETKFAVARWWKGPGTATAVVSSDGTNCEYQYSEGQTYLIFANGGGRLFQRQCATLPPFLLEDGHTYPEWGNVELLLDAVKARFDQIGAPLAGETALWRYLDSMATELPTGSLSGFVVDRATDAPIDLESVAVDFSAGLRLIRLNDPSTGQFRADELPAGQYWIDVGSIAHGGGAIVIVLGEDRYVDLRVSKPPPVKPLDPHRVPRFERIRGSAGLIRVYVDDPGNGAKADSGDVAVIRFRGIPYAQEVSHETALSGQEPVHSGELTFAVDSDEVHPAVDHAVRGMQLGGRRVVRLLRGSVGDLVPTNEHAESSIVSWLFEIRLVSLGRPSR